MSKTPLIFKTTDSVSGYAQLISKTTPILHKYYDCIELPLFNTSPNFVNYEKLNKNNQSATELVIASLPGDPYNTILSSLSCRKNCLLLTMWESTRLTGWHSRELESFKRIAVPSQWNVNCFNDCGFSNVQKVNLFVDDTVFMPKPKKDTSKFVFITGGSYLKDSGNDLRKNLPLITKLFSRAFPSNQETELWIKVSDKDAGAIGPFLDKRIKIFNHISDQKDYADFLCCGDVFISPAKAEGWGFMQIESLAVGRPIISPTYSGLTEFLNNDNHYPVLFSEKIASGNWGRSGGLWAEINEESMIVQMKKAYQEKRQIRSSWKRYSESVLPRFSLANYEKLLISFIEDKTSPLINK